MTKEDALALVPGDKVKCVDVQALCLEDVDTLFEWEVENVLPPSKVSSVTRVWMVSEGHRQITTHAAIHSKVQP